VLTNSITNRQLFFILLITLTSYSLVVIAHDMALSAGTGAWLVVAITALGFAVAASIMVRLANMFQGKTLFDYAPVLITKPGAYALCLYYIVYLLFILVFLVLELSRLLQLDFFPRSPTWSFPILGLPVFCFVAYKGITNVARLAEIIGIVFFITAILVHTMMTLEGRINRILPLFNGAEMRNYLQGFKSSVFPFLGIEVLLAIPLTQRNGKKAVKSAFLSLLAIGGLYIFVIESSFMKIGINDIINYKDALIVAIRDTSPQVLQIISRLDILYLTIGFGGLFLGISIVLLVIVEYLCRLFKKASRLLVVTAVGVATYILLLVMSGIQSFETFVTESGTYLGLFSSIVAPVTLFIIASAKRRAGKAGGHAG
jgi:spore germination protein (amino acid permease)